MKTGGDMVACGFESHGFRSERSRVESLGSRARIVFLALDSQPSALRPFSPVVQRQRRLAHIQETMVQFHPGLLFMSIVFAPRYANGKSDSA